MFRRLVLSTVLTLGLLAWAIADAMSGRASTAFEAYVTAQGQTLAMIAEEYGLSADYLAQLNRMPADRPLPGGQLIIIPGLPDDAVVEATLARDGEVRTPDGNLVYGKLGAVTVAKAQILDQPGKGKVLFDNAVRGAELLVLGEIGDYYALLMSDGSTGFILKRSVGLTERVLSVQRPTPPAVETTRYAPMVKTAFEYMGIPYKYGGRLPQNLDCSLLVQVVFARHGVRLPRTAAQQMTVGQPLQVQELQAGDRVYFYNRAGTRIGHTGIYIGEGRFIHASSNRGKVALDELANPTYRSIYAGARR